MSLFPVSWFLVALSFDSDFGLWLTTFFSTLFLFLTNLVLFSLLRRFSGVLASSLFAGVFLLLVLSFPVSSFDGDFVLCHRVRNFLLALL